LGRDKAFGFYYADDLDALQAAGAELVPFDTMTATRLPDADGLFIGGGFPEVFMSELEANSALREDIRNAIEAGLPVYAECGGLMYLARSLSWQGRTCRMVGVIPGDVVMHGKPVGRGYVRLKETAAHPWPHPASNEIRGHEFHYSSLENLDPGITYVYDVLRGHGIDGQRDGLVYKNVLACYAHLRSLNTYNWAERFVAFVRQVAKNRAQDAAPLVVQNV
jgi:cobyrinic acid a,c-diamide synthase